MKRYYSNGKLLLTGEYAVLDGGLCLALPTVYGQSLEAAPGPEGQVRWTSRDHQGKAWFEAILPISLLKQARADRGMGSTTEEVLIQLLREAGQMNPGFLTEDKGYSVVTKLDFPRQWGLGSSSTLINNIAQWAGIDPYPLLNNTLGGSGYDIACARHSCPIFFHLEGAVPRVEEIVFEPPFRQQLFFVYLNRKQDSREAIAAYRERKKRHPDLIPAIDRLTREVAACSRLVDFESLLAKHETLIGRAIGQRPVKEALFPDFPGLVKSLGAWGGDFVLASGPEAAQQYFRNLGYSTLIPYTGMIL